MTGPVFPCRHCDLPAQTCLDILERDGGYCCPGCEADDHAGIPSSVTHPQEPAAPCP